ncbi:nagb/rpia/CoA transferase-like protein [Choiromyces venosus 120613-1]|uniref:5-formyltetrahydrofolate cyclo-ligase n=1 Tax=Choiromyces venosus 120613-1 TaxID=1336337 RepID=A0A3N4JYD9_9PEZI|nr:nagb/rpia/CoA transferase-like protein [Choiromyces venosus 120613-1]
MASGSPLSLAKRNLRTVVKKTLSAISVESLAAQSQTCIETFLSLPEYQSSRRVSVFLSMPAKEIDTSQIVEDGLKSGKQLYVPHIHRHPPSQPTLPDPASASSPPSLMDMLSLHSLADYQSFKPDNWGIPTVPKDSISGRHNCLEHEESGLDLIVMPGVAFDEGFRRLGHGKGYYDYFLARYKQVLSRDGVERKERMPVLVALALKEQLFEDGTVPVDVSDWPMDVIISGDGRLLRR